MTCLLLVKNLKSIHVKKALEQQMTQLCMTVNPRQPNTLPRNIIQNTNNYGHCTAVTTREGKQIIDPHISSTVEV